MNKKQMEYRIEQLEMQAKDDYIDNTRWHYILDMLDDDEYAELKLLYIAMDNSMHTIMDNRGSEE